ncbi:hypothetical protein KC19_3G114600 [Ceratodon purpureus]|uniref:DUF4378 domain-containing protein n=2 Tax=Ceratodon purpureus TaxID=3225 RepID=A0A8T0IKT6_CERPU|nr:hypothetical protein KC19_3G114600 [Ceratodon purpureus]
MRVMDQLTESHGRTPSFHHAGAQSPRVGGCVGAFFNMFDWNPSKRFTSTRRITAERPNSEAVYARRDRSFTERTNISSSLLPQPSLTNAGKDEAFSTLPSTPTLSSTPSSASVKSNDTSKRVPGVVARLMGLESLPDGTYLSSKCDSPYLQSTLGCEQLDSPPVLLQELLCQEFQHSKKSLKEKLPGFTRRAQDSKSARGPVSQRKKSTSHFGENVHPYGDSRAPRQARHSEKKASAPQEDNKILVKQPFLARLPPGTPSLLPSKSQNSSSPLLSPSMLGGRNTVRLLDAAVKSFEPSMLPSPRSRSCLTRDTQSENGASFRSEKRVTTSSYGRVGSLSNSSSRSLKSQSISKTEHSDHLVAEMSSPGSRSSRSRHEPYKQDQASRRRFEMALVASAKSPSPNRARSSNSKRVEGSPRAVLGTYGRKQGDKKEGTDKGEALAMKRTDSTLTRSLSRRPSTTTGLIPASTSQYDVKRTTKSSRKVDVEVGVDKVETANVEAIQGSLEEASTPTQTQFDKTKDCHFVQTRHKSIDDVFPELPMEGNDVGGASPDLSKTIKAVEEQFLGFGSQAESPLVDCRSIERMFGKGFSKTYVDALSTSPDFSSFDNLALDASPISSEVFITECGSVPGTFPNSPLVNYEKIFFSSRNHLNLQDMFEVVSGDRPDDSTGRRRSFCLSESPERLLTPSDDEEAAGDLDTCSNSAVCDTGGTPERLEIQKMPVDPGWSEDAMMTPPALKKFEEKLAQESFYPDISCVEEGGQPSPVSVLENPFLDEGPTTPDASLAGSQEADGDDVKHIGDTESSYSAGDEVRTQNLKKDMLATNGAELAASLDMVETEKIKQAILDISRFRNIDVASIGLEPPTVAPVDPQQEQNYVREVLDAANMLREGECSWYSADSPMNHSLFDRLEFGSIKLDERTLMESKRWGSLPDAPRQGSSIRSERKLLFDSINEALALKPWMKTSSFHLDLPMFPDLRSNSKFRSPISGEPLVKEVYRTICRWREIAGNVLEDLMDYDMNVPEGRWVDFSHEVADIGLDIEQMLMKDILEEFVDDLASIYKPQALTSCS